MRFVNLLVNLVLFLVGAVVAAMFAAGESTYLESDGNAVTVGPLVYDVDSKQVVVIDGWLGIASSRAESGEELALDISSREYQFKIPSGLDVAKGDIVYITVATTTAYVPDDAAYTKTSGAGKVAFFKATSAHYTDKDGDRAVTGIVCIK